ncbi:gamma-glutamyltranspeptidase [Byssothecium circinans]|uniref:Gamma-glutamyltranspeptidase n=1 Tax=Byssothecium circinans TaxID=147558 RepID=A0A6A5TCX2_9PLEO|nr:gamma-glutamyltranspeptidase [Byssothecium circinans]
MSRVIALAGGVGAVVSGNALCSQIGTDVLESGGNAADAIVAAELCLGVVYMFDTGPGGGGFALVRSPEGKYECVDFRETAPASAFEDMFKDNDIASLRGGLASGVPGNLRGLAYIHKKHGSKPWAQLLHPAIELASHGFAVYQDLVDVFGGLEDPSFLIDDPAWAADFSPNGRLLRLGEQLKRPRYADFLRTIAKGGAEAFYLGPLAEATVKAVQTANGTMTLEDLAHYTPIIREPVIIQYREFLIRSCGAPGGGGVVLNVLKTAEGYCLSEPNQLNISMHRLVESMRFGYGARTQLGDPSFVINVTDFQDSMLSNERAERVRSKISDENTLPVDEYNPDGLAVANTHGTSHLSAADKSGMTIALTSTINLWFGSRVQVPETGLILNNEMNDFSIPGVKNAFGYPPSPANFIRPGKRPLSSMSPTIVEYLNSGHAHSTVGAAGGSRIISAVVQALWSVLDRGFDYQEALRMPRFHDQLQPNVTEFEYEFNNATTAFLASKGHSEEWAVRGSDMHALWTLPDGRFAAAADPALHNASGIAV